MLLYYSVVRYMLMCFHIIMIFSLSLLCWHPLGTYDAVKFHSQICSQGGRTVTVRPTAEKSNKRFLGLLLIIKYMIN